MSPAAGLRRRVGGQGIEHPQNSRASGRLGVTHAAMLSESRHGVCDATRRGLRFV
jgi:hypothetical protein